MLIERLKTGFIEMGSFVLPSLLLITGTQFILFAMLFDRANSVN